MAGDEVRHLLAAQTVVGVGVRKLGGDRIELRLHFLEPRLDRAKLVAEGLETGSRPRARAPPLGRRVAHRPRFRPGRGVVAAEQPVPVLVERPVPGRDPPVRDQQQFVHRASEKVAVMGHDDESAPIGLESDRQRVAHVEIEVVGRLVEEEQGGLPPRDEGEGETGLLASREERGTHERRVPGETPSPEEVSNHLIARLRVRGGQVLHRALRGLERLHGVLGEIADGRVVAAFAAAREERKLARNASHQGRLSGPVPAEKSDPRSGPQNEVHVRQHGARPFVSEARVLDVEQGIRHPLRTRKRESVRGVGVGGGDDGEPLELLQAASRLPGLGRLRAEAGDECFDLARAAALLLEGRPLAREALASLVLERGEAAAISAGAAPFEMHDVGRRPVEEVPVVRDQQGRAGAAHEPLLQPHHRVEIEVVGRLVKEEEVRAAHQRLREVEPDPPPSREVRDGAGEVFRAEPEPVEDPSRPRFRGVAVDGLELRIEGGEPAVVTLALRRLDGALDRAERPVAVHRPVEGGRGTRLRLLGKVGDGPAPRNPDIALLGKQAAAEKEEEARLADPVPPHDAGPVARVHREVEPREQGLLASLEGDVGEMDHRRRAVSRRRRRGAPPRR